GQRMILSNNHVLAASNDARRGDAILQPGPADSGTREDVIGTLERFAEIRFEGLAGERASMLRRLAARLGFRTKPNFVDAAIARPTRDELVSDEILDVNRVPGIAEAEVGLRVMKSGRTTGVTAGKILATDAT